MKQSLIIITLSGLALIAGPTKPNVPTYKPGSPVTLMELSRTDGELIINDDNGQYLGTVNPEGKLHLAKGVKQEVFFLGLVNALRSGTPKDYTTEAELQACLATLKFFELPPLVPQQKAKL